MKITYDREVDALYIRFEETIVTTKHLAEGIAADYDGDGRLAGIEILDAKKRLGDPDAFKQVILEDVAIASPSLASTAPTGRDGTTTAQPWRSARCAKRAASHTGKPAAKPYPARGRWMRRSPSTRCASSLCGP